MGVLLCLVCDHTFESGKTIDEATCESCSSDDCVYTSHINEGTRKRWVKFEESGKWFKNKKIKRSLKNDLCEDVLWSERLESITDDIFNKINNSNCDDLFPYYRIDYPRTFGKKTRLWRTDNAKKTKRGSIRGEMYEVLFNKIVDKTENIERGLEKVTTKDEKSSCRPDAWVSFGPVKRFPLEFKTIAKGDWTLNKLKKMIIQSRKQGEITHKAGIKNSRNGIRGISMLVVCCPEERNYASFLFDERVEGRILHFKGEKSLKRISREKNRRAQQQQHEMKLKLRKKEAEDNAKLAEKKERLRLVEEFKRRNKRD